MKVCILRTYAPPGIYQCPPHAFHNETRPCHQQQKTNERTDKPLNDPSKPENWGATDTSKNIKAKFIDTDDYNNYLNEISKIQKKLKQ